MPLPKLRDAEIAWIIQQVAEYIGQQRQTYREKALPLDAHQRSAMQPFFPSSALDVGRYEAIPPEMNAYGLDARFATAPAKPFSVADEVQAWIDAGRF